VLSLSLAAVLGYFFGSIPVAFLIVRSKSRVDIREAGSGNVGMLNSYEVTGSLTVGSVVLLLDLLKGAGAVLVAGCLVSEEFSVAATAGVSAVVGHNFPIWLSFKGGRGLATGAGVFGIICWVVVVIWVFFWGVGYWLTKRVNPANAIACLMLLTVVIIVPGDYLGSLAPGVPVTAFRFFASLILGIILLKHYEPVLEFIQEKKKDPTG
jgi:glycerol-3-phosphate acyltransferase PlsY